MEGKFLITYTIKEDNSKALNAIECFLTKYGFEKERDQSTYIGGNRWSLKELQDAICGVRYHLKDRHEEHITLYYACNDKIVCG